MKIRYAVYGCALIGFGYLLGCLGPQLEQDAVAQEMTVSPVKARAPRDVYLPNTEDLASDEMRVIACGTGMPIARLSQAATCFLVELGNGDKFLFDIGSGAADRISGLEIPYDYLDKVFISHLHSDHFGDLPVLYIGGWVAGRVNPLRVWGPSGTEDRLGTKHAIEGMKEMLAWDLTNRRGRLPATGGDVQVTEFDYMGMNQVVFQENGVTIRSWPAIHGLDGSVSYALEWNGLKLVFGGDTYPNKWFIEYAKDADISIHECMMTAQDYISKMKFPPNLALEIGTRIHTSPAAFGKIMSATKPRLAVAYHFFYDHDTVPGILEGIRSTYDGPLTAATDFVVWNVTKDSVRVRDAIPNEDAWPPPPAQKRPDVDRSIAVDISKKIRDGSWDVHDADQPTYDAINKKYGTDFKQAGKRN